MSTNGVYVSALEFFSIGIGPSSSHTVGPMRAAHAFVGELESARLTDPVDRIRCNLHGSLAATGIGHCTPDAVIAGLRGLDPETCEPADVHGPFDELSDGGSVMLAGGSLGHVVFTRDDMVFEPLVRRHGHPNSMTLTAFEGHEIVYTSTYLSIGGGFVVRTGAQTPEPTHPIDSHYRTAKELLAECGSGTIADLALADEIAMHGQNRALAGIDAIWSAMRACIERGMHTVGVLPGKLGVRRRAQSAKSQLEQRNCAPSSREWLTVYAMAVNEENAAGGRVVTAPTNGAAGIVPAVLYHHIRATGAGVHDVRTFLLTAAAIGSIIKANASISGAEAGCQGEVGAACAMAAAGLCAVMGGSPRQIENAAEIAMEHHLGLTCDPVGGLVQIPCIERNAVAASTAVTAAQLAYLGDGTHVVSLDTVIETMRQTGNDMSVRYKETSEGGLAVNVVEC
ncbi:L-serine ammonia-lyase [Rhodococcus sp. NPDC055024]